MSKLVLSLFVAAGLFAANVSYAEEGDVKKVCVDVMKDGKPVKDAKGNVKQSCRNVKIHKKHEATAVPEKKK